MQTVLFNPSPINIYAEHLRLPNQSDIKQTKQLFQANYDFAYKHGGRFVQKFLDHLPNFSNFGSKHQWVIDTKVHMLKPGWFPGIPGWHVDFAPGWEHIVDWSQIDGNEMHFCTITDSCSRTEFINDPLLLNVPYRRKINGHLSRQIAALDNAIKVLKAEPGTIYQFGQLNLHRVAPATESGWRLFVRASWTALRQPMNEIRTQGSQVYILANDEHSGW